MPPAVAAVFDSVPARPRRRLLELRSLILETAAAIDDVGPIEETLKWGEPAYLTTTRSGTTIRLGWKESEPTRYRLLVHCQTDLIETFRQWLEGEVALDGNRAIVLDVDEALPRPLIARFVEAALTYHRR